MKRFKSIVVASFVIAIAIASLAPALPTLAVSSASLSIVPKKNYTIEPGKTIKDTLVIRNLDANEPLELALRVVDFTFTDDGGTPKLMLASDAPQMTWSLKPFMSIPESVTIAPKSTKTIDMSVAIPAGHGAGSYYSAIVYSSGASDGGNVGLSASGVTLVFTSIPGKVNEALKLEEFGAYHAAKAGQAAKYSVFTVDKPEMIAYTLKNTGNVTESPVGSIILKDIFGRETVINDVNPNKSLALIGQTRTFTACIKLESETVAFNGSNSRSTACTEPSLLPGIYTASLDIFYGQNGNNTNEITKTTTFFYFPVWFIILSIIVLVIAGLYVRKAVHAVRRKLGGGKTYRKPSRRR